MKIPFNKPYLSGNELKYIEEAVNSGKISGNGKYTKKCQAFFEKNYGFKKCLMTTSCTDALEMSALLLNIEEGDEVILPSYTFVSTANAFALRGAKLVFADSQKEHPNIDHAKLESLINSKTKAIVIVHYAGVACKMDEILNICKKHKIYLIEDAAHAVDSHYKGKALGSFGDLATFSFHETKNIISGEGGLLAINNDQFVKRAEIIWEKGTNRAEFFRGEIDKYGWVDIGSSFLPSEVISAFLFAQLEKLKHIQQKRIEIWNSYKESLRELEDFGVKTPVIPDFAENNAHMFYLICNSLEERSKLIEHLSKDKILAVFHYGALEKSAYFKGKHDGRELENSSAFADRLVRLPLYFELTGYQQKVITESILSFYKLQAQTKNDEKRKSQLSIK